MVTAAMNVGRILTAVAPWIPSRERWPVVALCYHGLTDEREPVDRFEVARDMFSEHLSLIRATGHSIIEPRQFAEQTSGVLITFDDNLPSHVHLALPALVAADAKALFFLNPGELDQPRRLQRRDVDTLVEAGMSIGAHNYRHRVVIETDPDEFAADVDKCRAFLLDLGMPLTWAYPGGDPAGFNPIYDQILRQRGFNLRFSTLEGPCTPGDAGQVQSRYVIRNDCSKRYLISALRGGLQIIRLSKRARAMIPIRRDAQTITMDDR